MRRVGGDGAYAVIDGVRLYYCDEGPADAPALVFSNSLGTDLRMWEPQARAFAGSYRVIRYDSRGHGRSDAPPGPYTLERLGADLLALLDTLEIAQARVCGLSLGGMVALWLATYHPERVARAVFANTAARIGSTASWDQRIESVRAGGMEAIRDGVLARFFSEPFRLRQENVTHFVGEMLQATRPEGYIGACAALRDADLRAVVGRIRAPSLVLTGALDESTPPAQSRALHAAIAGSQLVILDEDAHLSNLEQPDQFNTHVRAFLGAGRD